MALTMEQLNAIYNDMSVYGDTYGDTVAPMPVDNASGINNIDLTSAPISNIKPYLPIIPQGEGRDDIFEKSYYKYNDDKDPFFKTRENKTGLAALFELYQKYSPLANIMKMGKTGIETAQKYFVDKKETERLEALAQIEQARKQKEAQATIAAAEEKSKQIAANRIQAANEQNRTGGYQAGYGSDFMGGGGRDRGNDPSSAGGSDTMGSFKKGGRTGYGTGGIVTL